MPSLKLTIEDNSPIILYSSNWIAGQSADTLMDRYSQSSFTLTNVLGESASFYFNGTGVQIYGAKRGNHGPYHINMDNGANIELNGTVADPGDFQTSLYSVTGLQQGLHQVTITNDAAAYLDIDFITWETRMGNSGDNITATTFQDTDPSFVYSPSSSTWTTIPERLGSFLGGSGHATNVSGASFTYTFQVSEGVSLYGPVGPNGSSYAVQLDGRPWSITSSTKQFYVPQTMLYHANNLDPGVHQLQMQCQSTSPTQSCAIDYAVAYTTSSVSPALMSQATSHLSNGALVGITAACVVSLFVLLGLLGLLWRRKARGQRVNLAPDLHPVVEPASAVDPGGSQVTTARLFPLSSPSIPSSYDPLVGASQQNLAKVHMEYRVVNGPSQGDTSNPISHQPGSSHSTVFQRRPQSSDLEHSPLGPGDGLPPGYSAYQD